MKKLIVILTAVLTLQLMAESSAITILKDVEGFSSSVYLCQAGKKTIGYGFTDKESLAKGTMTEKEAQEILSTKITTLRKKLREEVGRGYLTWDEESAVVSFIYNVGWSAFKSSTMCRLIKQKASKQLIAKEFGKWKYVTVRGKKVVSNGLVNRRKKEARLFLNHVV